MKAAKFAPIIVLALFMAACGKSPEEKSKEAWNREMEGLERAKAKIKAQDKANEEAAKNIKWKEYKYKEENK